MIEITKENITEICQKMNDMVFDDATDKEICGWFISQIYDFNDDIDKYEGDGYDYYDISIEYFGAQHVEKDIIDIDQFDIVDDRIKLYYTYKKFGAKINDVIWIPLGYMFDRPVFKKTWETEMVKKKIRRLSDEMNGLQREIDILKGEIDKERRKISFVS